MKKFLELISEEMGKGFEAAGYEAQLGRVTVSNRPDLCEYQCNGAMAGAKKYHKAPIMIANDVAEKLTDSAVFSEVSAVAPGFLNLKVKDSFVCEYLKEMAAAEKFGVEPPEKKKPSLSITAAPTLQSRSTSVICAPQSSAKASSGSTVTKDIGLSAMSIWATGDCRWV